MTSYEKFTSLCKARQVSPTAALLASGLSRSLGSKWKSRGGFTPSTEAVQKLCKYFGVSADYFIQDKPDPVSYFKEPVEFAPLMEAAMRLTPDQRAVITKFAQFVYPEAFDEV